MSRLWTSALLSLLPLTAGCADGLWQVETWGEDYIESGIPSAEFTDGCSATFTHFAYMLSAAHLQDGDGQKIGDLETQFAIDVHAPGPHLVGEAPLTPGVFDQAVFRIGPSSQYTPLNGDAADTAFENGANSIALAGELTCGEKSVTFDWKFATDTTYICDVQGLSISSNGVGSTEFTIHGDHFFYDGLEDPEANLRGEAIVQADANGDGHVTLEELSQISVAPLGYSVGRYSEVEDLAAFITHLSRTVGHVDGEGHCSVDL